VGRPDELVDLPIKVSFFSSTANGRVDLFFERRIGRGDSTQRGAR
jgi:hypothetical protein